MELAELIFEKRVIPGQPEWFADLFGRLMWLTADNGAEIRGTLGCWLDGQDVEKVRIALAFDEDFLWDSTSEMDRRLANVLSRFPGEAQRCKAARDRWIIQAPRMGICPPKPAQLNSNSQNCRISRRPSGSSETPRP